MSALLRRLAALVTRLADSLDMPPPRVDPAEERLLEMRNRLARYY